MIYITGDLHGSIDFHKLTTAAFPEQKHLTKTDYVIICGDFGCIWNGSKSDKYLIKELNNRNFTTLFVDGNHECFPLLNAYPEERWNGGRIHRIADSVIHLMRGQVFEFGGFTWFTMGGASSHDKQFREEGRNWWPEELPSVAEYSEAIKNLEAANWKVNFVLTHCAPDSIVDKISCEYEPDKLTNFLQSVVKENAEYDAWFCGHYHTDKKIEDNYFILYMQIVEIGHLEG